MKKITYRRSRRKWNTKWRVSGVTNLFDRPLCNEYGMLCYDCLRYAIHRR